MTTFEKMRRILILLLVICAVSWSMPTERPCDVTEAHARFGVPRVVDDGDANNFVLALNGVEEGFLPEIEYGVSLKSIGDPFQEFIVTAHNNDPYCEDGTMIDKYDIGTSDEACPHAIRHALITDMRTVSFSWKAPECGCVTLRASLKTDGIVYSEASFEKGTLLKEVCVTGMNKPDESEEQLSMENDELLDEEPFYNAELYDNIERLCEEGNFRGKFLPAIIQECCSLLVHQRRMCLIRVIPAEENDVHRLNAFCSQMTGNFFEGHPVLANAEGVRRCCELTGNSTRMVCLTEEKRVHFDEVCGLISVAMNNTEHLPGRNCCSLEGDLRYNCMDKKALRESQKRRLEERRSLRRQAEKVRRLCNAVDQAPEGDRDSEDYQLCCMIEDAGDALVCFKEVEVGKFDALCKRQALRYSNGHTEKVHPCCSMQNDTRYECFLERRSSRDRIQSSDSNRPTWMQRTCARLRDEDGDKVLRACCRKPSYLLKRKCMDNRLNLILKNICSTTSKGAAYVIIEGGNSTAAEQNLNPEHECCILEGSERLACTKKMQIFISTRKRGEIQRKDSFVKQKRVETSREQKEQRWVQEETRQNEAICTRVREEIDMLDEQIVRCCERDGENQRECLAVLRRNHFTAVCNTEALFQIDIFNSILRTEDPIDNEHRCCMRPNADIRAACFSRVDRQVAMLSYSPPVIEEVQEIRTELLDVAEFNRIDSVCLELASATPRELRGRWPAKKCCRYRNNRKYTCLMDAARKLADQSCDGPSPRVYFPVGFYAEYISSDYTGPFLDPTHPCCSLTGDMRQQCIRDASLAVLALRLPILAETPLDEFFKVMPFEMRFGVNHQDAICQAATSFQDFYADLENGLDVELNRPTLIQEELQELQELLADELTEEEEEQAEMLAEQEEERLEILEEQAQQLAEQNLDNWNEEEEEEEEEEEDEDDRRRKRRQANKFKRPTTKNVRASAGRSIYEVDSLVYCCQEESLTERKTCMTTLWLQLLHEACVALPELPMPSHALAADLEPDSEGLQGNTNLLVPAPLKFGARGDIHTSKATGMPTSESTVDQNSDKENFRMCCSLFGQDQLECFQAHYSPSDLSSLIESGGSDESLNGGSELGGSESESEGQGNVMGSENESSDGEDAEESEGEEEPQEQMGSEGQESEGNDGEEMEESEAEEEPQEQIGSEGQESEGNDGEEMEESEAEEEPQEQIGSEGQESEGNDGEEEDTNSGEVSEGYMAEGSDMGMPELGSSAGTGDVPLGVKDAIGQINDPKDIEELMTDEEQDEEVTEEPEQEIELQDTEEQTGGWFWWSGSKKPQQNEQYLEEVDEQDEDEEEEEEFRRRRDVWSATDMEESEGLNGEEDPQGQMESEGQESEAQEYTGWWWNWMTDNNEPQTQEQHGGEEGEEEEDEEEEEEEEIDDRRRRDLWGASEEPEGSDGSEDPQEHTESEVQETEAQEQTGWWWNWMIDDNEPQTQEQHDGEEGEGEEEEDEDEELSEGVEEPQGQIGNEGQKTEAQEQHNVEEEKEEEEEDEVDEEELRKKRDIWSAMELLSNIDEKQMFKSHLDSPRRNNNKGPSRHHSGRIFGKLSLLKLLFRSDMLDNVCPAVESADNINSVIASLFQKTKKIPDNEAHKRKDHFRESDEMLLQLQECCALNATDETAECFTTIALTLVDGICNLEEGGFRPRPAHAKGQAWAKKRLFRGCCNETGEERYSCARGYLAPANEIQEIVDEDPHEMEPIDLLRSVSQTLGRLLSLNDQADDDQPEIIDQEITLAPTL